MFRLHHQRSMAVRLSKAVRPRLTNQWQILLLKPTALTFLPHQNRIQPAEKERLPAPCFSKSRAALFRRITSAEDPRMRTHQAVLVATLGLALNLLFSACAFAQ